MHAAPGHQNVKIIIDQVFSTKVGIKSQLPHRETRRSDACYSSHVLRPIPESKPPHDDLMRKAFGWDARIRTYPSLIH